MLQMFTHSKNPVFTEKGQVILVV